MFRVVQPVSSDLALLSDLKLELNILDTSKDVLLQSLLTRSSQIVINAIGRPLHRQKYRESLPSFGTGRLYVKVTPVAGLPLAYWMSDPYADFDSATLSPIENLFVSDRRTGALETMTPVRSTARILPGIEYTPIVGTEIDLIRVDYWGGWFPPGSRFEKDTISFAATDQSINDSASGFPLSLQTDDEVSIYGSSNNSGRYRVKTVTAAKIELEGLTTIVDEVAGDTITVDYRNLPGDIEDAVLMLSKLMYFARARDVSVRYQRTQDLEVWYLREADVGTRFPPQIRFVVDSYKRVLT